MHDEKTGPQDGTPVTPDNGDSTGTASATPRHGAGDSSGAGSEGRASGAADGESGSGTGSAAADYDAIDLDAINLAAAAGGDTPRAGASTARWSVEEALSELNAKQKAEIEEKDNRLKYLAAELDNTRKRHERERADTARFAISKFAEDILPLADTIQRAMALVPADAIERDEALKRFVDGVMMIEGNLLATLERHGIQRLDPLGEKFDPNRHQAVMEDTHPEIPKGHVSMVHQAGYLIAERVLRTAMVTVSSGAGTASAAAQSASQAAPVERPQSQSDNPVSAGGAATSGAAARHAANDDEAPGSDDPNGQT